MKFELTKLQWVGTTMLLTGIILFLFSFVPLLQGNDLLYLCMSRASQVFCLGSIIPNGIQLRRSTKETERLEKEIEEHFRKLREGLSLNDDDKADKMP